MNPTTFTSLPSELVGICASYLPPPELRRLAQYEPPITSEELRGEHSRVLEIWSRFRTSYDSAATWDLQAGIDPKDVKRKGTGRKVIEERYRAINAVAIQRLDSTALESVSQSDQDPFTTNAHLQGVLIQETMGIWEARSSNVRSIPHSPKWGAQILVQAMFSPVYELDADSSSCVLSKDFYNRKFPVWAPWWAPSKENPALVSTRASCYEQLVQDDWRNIYAQCVNEGHERLCRMHVRSQGLEVLELHLTRLAIFFRHFHSPAIVTYAVFATAASTATAASVSTPAINPAQKRLEDFEDHFHQVITSCGPIIPSSERVVPRQAPGKASKEQLARYRLEDQVREFLFRGLRTILNLPHSAEKQRFARTFKEELVQRNIRTASEVNQRWRLHDDPLDLADVGVMINDYLYYLLFLESNPVFTPHGFENSAAAQPQSGFSAIDGDEGVQGYLIRFQQLFKEVIPLLQGDEDSDEDPLVTALSWIHQTPSCQAACTIFTLVYQEVRRRGLRDRIAPSEHNWMEPEQLEMDYPPLARLIRELAAKEEASSKAFAAAE